MKKIVIVGAGGFGREVKMLIDQINLRSKEFDFLGFYDDTVNLLCQPCNPYCRSCNGGTQNSCLTCQTLHNRVISGNSCFCATGI